jgi:hypothetical protein
MKNQKSKKIIFGILSTVFVAGLNQEAHAAFSVGPLTFGPFVDPSLTYEKGDGNVNYPASFSSGKGELDGFGIGARAGVHVSEIVFVGIDARYSMLKYKDTTANYDESATAFNWGPVAGVQMPIAGLRVWGSYIIGGELDPDSGNSFDVKFKGVDGYRVGAGVRVLITSLNLEYQKLSYDEVMPCPPTSYHLSSRVSPKIV